MRFDAAPKARSYIGPLSTLRVQGGGTSNKESVSKRTDANERTWLTLISCRFHTRAQTASAVRDKDRGRAGAMVCWLHGPAHGPGRNGDDVWLERPRLWGRRTTSSSTSRK
jgi:hypothetical protein